jgi:hypothetical protein
MEVDNSVGIKKPNKWSDGFIIRSFYEERRAGLTELKTTKPGG